MNPTPSTTDSSASIARATPAASFPPSFPPVAWHAAPALIVAAEEGPVTISFAAVAAYHGQGALTMLALTFQGLCGALAQLTVDGRPLPRREIVVTSGHSGPGVRDAFEFVTRAVTRNAYRVDTDLPWGRHHPNRSLSYSFVLGCHGRQVRAVLREGVLPPRFFELMSPGSIGNREEAGQLRRLLAENALTESPEALYEYKVEQTQS